MRAKKNYIVFTTICLVLGFFAVRQFYASKLVTKVTSAQESNIIASEVSGLVETNKKMRAQIEELNQEYGKLSQLAAGSQEARLTLEKNRKTYEIVAGERDVKGPGVEIQINRAIEDFSLVDLVNALRNIGAEAISINDKRLVMKTFISGSVFQHPYSVKALGDKDLLYQSLTRPGGIMEQIGTGEVIKRDVLYFPKAE